MQELPANSQTVRQPHSTFTAASLSVWVAASNYTFRKSPEQLKEPNKTWYK